MRKLLVILGPTATGKTDLALNLAKKFNGEIVSCDSRQVYRGLDIGTGKYPSQKSKVKSKIWMYDVADPRKQYTVFNYVQDANKVINDIQKRKKLPIVVGGSGLYLKALLEGLTNLSIPVNKKLRNSLSKLSLKQLQNKLQKLLPKKWQDLNQSDRQNPRRLIRAIELVGLKPNFAKTQNFDALKIGLTAPRDVLYKRADRKVLARIKQGMIEETIKLHKKGLSFKRMRQLGLEYGVLADYLDGKIKDTNELIKIMQGKIHGYIRRQLTWFAKEKDVHWFNIMV